MRGSFILTFRRVDKAKGGPVTAGQLFDLRQVDRDYDWMTPGFRKRIGQNDVKLMGHVPSLQLFAQARICFIVHGFNVALEDGFGGAALAQELNGAGPLFEAQGRPAAPISDADLVITVLWPGDWWGPSKAPLNYVTEMGDVIDTARQFAAYIKEYCGAAASISFVTHSLGARVALDTMTKVLEDQGPGRFDSFDVITLLAAAANADIFDDPRYVSATAALRRIFVVSSHGDQVLNLAFRAGNPFQALWGLRIGGRAEKLGWNALGWAGPKLKSDSAARSKIEWYAVPDVPAHGHGDYMPHGSEAPPPGNGWNPQRIHTAEFVRSTYSAPPKPMTTVWPDRRDLP